MWGWLRGQPRIRSRWRRPRSPAPVGANYEELAYITARNASELGHNHVAVVAGLMASRAREMASQGRSTEDVLREWHAILADAASPES